MKEDELREALEKLRVEDVLIQTAATLIDLTARRLGLAGGDQPKQLDQAKLAIEAVRTLLPLLTEEQQKAVREPLSQLQLAYAREAQGAAGQAASPPGAGPDQPPGAGQDQPQPGAGDDPERAKARSKIWTPPGS